VDRVRQRQARRRISVLPVDGGCELMVERERIPRKAAVGSKRCGYPLEAAATIGPGRQMQQRPAGAVDQRRGLFEVELTDVSLPQVELDAGFRCTRSRLREHRPGRVDSDDARARCLSDRNRDATGTDRELDQQPVRLAGESNVERDVGG
jgi:hypothetical protein